MDIVKYFKEKGFDGNIKKENGSTALFVGKISSFDHFYLLNLFIIASNNGHLNIVKYFIEKGFDGNIQDKDGWTALHWGKITIFDHFYLLFLFFKASS